MCISLLAPDKQLEGMSVAEEGEMDRLKEERMSESTGLNLN